MYKANEFIDREGDSKGYETPTTFHVNGLSGPILYKPSTAIIIPDSPRRRARRTLKSNRVDMDTSDSEVHAPRAESPELTSTPPPYRRQLADAAPSVQGNGESPDSEVHRDSALQVSMPLPVSSSKPQDHPANLGDHDTALGGGVLPKAMPLSSPKLVHPPPRVAPLPSTRSNSSLREVADSSILSSTPDDSFDPISTDSENPHSKPWLSSFKRLKAKSKAFQSSPQVVNARPKYPVGVVEGFVNPRLSGQEIENPISPRSATSTKGNSKKLQYLPQADSAQFKQPVIVTVTMNEVTVKPIPPEKKAELQIPSESSGIITQESPQSSPEEPVNVNEVTVKPIPPEKKAELQISSESSGIITQESPQPSPEEPVTVNEVTVKPIPPEKKVEFQVPSKSNGIIIQEPSQTSRELGPSSPQNPVTMIEEAVKLKPSDKEADASAPSASTSSTGAKRKRFQPLSPADPPRSPKVASSAGAAVKPKPSDTKMGSMIPSGFIGSTAVNRCQLQPSPQASSARTEDSLPVSESAVQPEFSKETRVAASAKSSKDRGGKPKSNGATRTINKANGAAAGDKMLADRKVEKDEEPKLKAVTQPEEEMEKARIADTQSKPSLLHENANVKEDSLVGLTTDSLPKSSLRRSERSKLKLGSPGARSEGSWTTTRTRQRPGPDPSCDLSGDSRTLSARRKEPNRIQKLSKLLVPNGGTGQSPQDEPKGTAVNSTMKAIKTLAATVDTRILSEPSSPRGPAQYMSRPHSAGSITSMSSSDSDSDSQDGMLLLRQAVNPVHIKSEQGMKSLGHYAENSRVLANSEISIGKRQFSKIGYSPISISSRDSDSSEGTGSETHAEEPESHQPMKPGHNLEPSILIPNSLPGGRELSSSEPLSRPRGYSATSRSILNEKSAPVPSKATPKAEPPSSSAPGGARPTNSRYPSMTQLIKKPRPTEQSRSGKISPPKSAATRRTGGFSFHSFSGSSSSDTSSSEDGD